MTFAEKLSVVVPADRLEQSVGFWSRILGPPTLVDGQRWAQFDVGGTRLALGADGERPNVTTVLVKVSNLDAAIAQLDEHGIELQGIEEGEHERRVAAQGPTGEVVVLYQPRG
jgi:catechol 2,3-dioxygenase-like lactoylglutathione lyase family enzyme